MNAVQIKNGQAKILHSRCITCGKCVKSCPQNAKVVIDNKSKALKILEENEKIIACLAPSFISSFYPYSYKKVVGALKKLGFTEVWEVAVGAEVLSKQLDNFLNKNPNKTYLSTACPSFVAMIEKHYPELITHLLPFDSPMIATGKIIRKSIKDKGLKVIFIGPCIAKKAEAMEAQFSGIIDCVLTFDELKDLFIDNNIQVNNSLEEEFDNPKCSKGRLFPIDGGMMYNLEIVKRLKRNEFISISSHKDCMDLINVISKNKISARLVDALMCKGCIEGPKINNNSNYYEKTKDVYEFYESSCNDKVEFNIDVDLLREFKNKRNILPFPSEEEIKRILEKTNKVSKEDELNCGACGYSTCRDKAIAVCQGIAELDMCLPYLLSKKTKLFEELSDNYREIKRLKDELETIIESSYDGIVVTDGLGKVLKVNKAWIRMVGYEKMGNDELVLGMEEKGVIFPSATMLALKEKRRVSFIQNSAKGKKFLATGTPIFDDNENISRVVTNIRDIDELNKLRKQIEETIKLEKYYSKDKRMDKLDFNSENIVANSIEFGKILQIASNVAGVDSTVLILGESGVGKEVVANFIHKLSKRKDKSFIKINCGAIPENLIESELFGYETGAFTGANRKGKHGLIELAHEGTLFLDEIGDLPLNLQVKLLRVIQEKKLIRLGGVIEIDVNVRIIAATNRDLKKMVDENRFRADLYYRLNVVPLEIPPLRKRKSDILPLSYHFINIFNKKYGCNKDITSSVEKILLNYSWPGNIRELENIMERLIVTTKDDLIDEKDLPIFLLEEENSCEKVKLEGILPLKEATEILERKLIKRAYKKYGTTYEMAEALGVNQSTVVRKIQKYLKSNALKHN
ncbi:PAS domain S-box-containing protein [Paramaledivibacter caminithermalis DSM 15212]|uniref:HTH-type transcriptional regulatory protein TyrR n=1 Tax=Paramaledivibacter caminithermalis (strain DSM 15212 / CIP 107654 / DViRD3) TaxID=1121301 RepID=A0A1M6PUG4_PARC5|nr:PAS domain S-box-containing protein [Paramaledivibacter caminithermalis DSM 15212]